MAWQYQLNNKAHDLVEKIYPVFKGGEFTTTEAANLMGTNYRMYGSTMGSLAMRGVIERSNGAKRSHSPGKKHAPPTKWRFTKRFLKWYEGKYLESH